MKVKKNSENIRLEIKDTMDTDFTFLMKMGI